MEAVYEYFYEIHAYALAAGVIYLIYQPGLSHLLRNSNYNLQMIKKVRRRAKY